MRPFDNEQFAVGKLGYSTASLYPTIPRMPRTIIIGGPGGTRTHYQSIMSRRLIPLKLPALAWSARCYPKATSCEQFSTAAVLWLCRRTGKTRTLRLPPPGQPRASPRRLPSSCRRGVLASASSLPELRVRARSAEYNRSGGTPNSGLAHHCLATFMAAGAADSPECLVRTGAAARNREREVRDDGAPISEALQDVDASERPSRLFAIRPCYRTLSPALETPAPRGSCPRACESGGSAAAAAGP